MMNSDKIARFPGGINTSGSHAKSAHLISCRFAGETRSWLSAIKFFEYQVASANPSHANICLIYYMQTNVREWLAWHNKKR